MAAKRDWKPKRTVVGGPKAEYRPWNQWKAEDFVIGKYISKRKDGYGKMNRMIEVLEAEFGGKPKLAAGLVGKVLGLNANGMLDFAFNGNKEKGIDPIKVGEIVKVTYEGMTKMEKGKYAGKDSHQIKVEIMTDEDEESEDDEDQDEEEEVEESEEESDDDSDSDEDDEDYSDL